MALRYHEAAPETFEEPQVMAYWLRLALEAALRGGKRGARRPAAGP